MKNPSAFVIAWNLMPVYASFTAVLLLVCRLSCQVACDVLYVHKPAALNKASTSVLCGPTHHYWQKQDKVLHIAKHWQKSHKIHNHPTIIDAHHQHMPSLTCKMIHTFVLLVSDSPPTAHSHKPLNALKRKQQRGVAVAVYWFASLFFFRPTRKTPRGPPQWRASRFFCRSSWRANRCRRRWLSLSMRGTVTALM